MLIKFESKQAASFQMQKEVAQRLLTLIGQGGKIEGSISGADLDTAIHSLNKALASEADAPPNPEDEEAEDEHVSLSARAAPLKELLQHAKQEETYVMWSPE